MKAWKHHLAENFENAFSPTHNNGAGVGATIFTNYDKMLVYLKKDGRRWYIAELDVKESEIARDMFDDAMATILVNKKSKKGFKEINL
jgi:hypothetical protein